MHRIRDNDIDVRKIYDEGFEDCVLRGEAQMFAESRISCIQLEYGKVNLFSRTFIHDYMRGYGEDFTIRNLYPAGVHWFSRYSADLDDLLWANLVMISCKRPGLIELVLIPRALTGG